MSDTPETDAFFGTFADGEAAPSHAEYYDRMTKLERERDEARKELDALKATIAKSGLIEVEATTCIADKCGKPTIVKDGTMLVHKDEKLRIQQRTVDLQKHAATARKLTAERALADRLAEAIEAIWPFIEEDIPHGCNSTAYMNAIELCRANITPWKEARSEV